MKIKCKSCQKLKSKNEFYLKQSICIDCKKSYFQDRKHSLSRRYSTYKDSALKRDLHFELTLEQFDDLTKGSCFYCDGFSFKDKINGIDRLDSDIGYELKNCVSCCKTCNMMKMALDKKKFIAQVKKISKKLKLA